MQSFKALDRSTILRDRFAAVAAAAHFAWASRLAIASCTFAQACLLRFWRFSISDWMGWHANGMGTGTTSSFSFCMEISARNARLNASVQRQARIRIAFRVNLGSSN
jgi:hypothetical protein